MKKFWWYLAACMLSQNIGTACAFESFTVKDIQIEGLQRISQDTVYNYLPVHAGDVMSGQKTREVIHALFQTGFFQDIQLDRSGNNLVIRVIERPTIGKISVSGNKDIKTENMMSTLKGVGLAEGHVFDRANLELMRNELERMYYSSGKYGVKVDANVQQQKNNRVNIDITINEGEAARIKAINIIGNHRFPQKQLLNNFTLSPTNTTSWISRSDQYDKQKLSADLETLRSFYFDRGYLNFKITSTQVSITPDKQDIIITINMEEGAQFSLSGFELQGNTIVPAEELRERMPLKTGEVFSRAKIVDIVKQLTERLGQEGYAFAKINPVPELNEEDKTVKLIFYFEPGHRINVRRVLIEGNTKTKDEVIRREVIQMESGPINTRMMEEGRLRLNRTGFFSEVKVRMEPVPGAPDTVDIIYTVEETTSGQLGGGVGYSDVDGLLFNANVTNRNFMGTGNNLDLAFNNSKAFTTYNLGYNNPYYTIDGVSRGFSAFYSKTDLSKTTNISNYTTNVWGGNVSYGIPISPHDRFTYGLGFQSTDLIVPTIPGPDGVPIPNFYSTPTQIIDFLAVNGSKSEDFALALGWNHNTLDRYMFPRNGLQQSAGVNVTVPGSDLTYYRLSYNAQWYKSLPRDFVFTTQGTLGYGNGYGSTEFLPFYKNFYAGGMHSVRGYQENSLGPRDSLGNPYGGNFLAAGSVAMILPNFFLPETNTVRMGWFVDGGQVYDIDDDATTNPTGFRFSTGLSVTWMSPIAPLTLSYAFPLNAKRCRHGEPCDINPIDRDNVKNFAFTFGTVF